MDDITRWRIESFDRDAQWFADHSTGVDSNGKLKDTKNAFVAKLADLHTEVGTHAAAESEGKEQTEVKADSREDGILIADKVHTAAKGAEIEQPAIEARYPRPRNLNLEDLIALLRSFAIGGAQDEDIIKAYGAPDDWVAQCTATANAIEAAGLAQSSAKEQKVGTRASILAKVDELMQLARTPGHIIENVFSDDPAALASWKTASHVKQPPKKKKTP